MQSEIGNCGPNCVHSDICLCGVMLGSLNCVHAFWYLAVWCNVGVIESCAFWYLSVWFNVGVIESCAFWYLAVWCNVGVIESCAFWYLAVWCNVGVIELCAFWYLAVWCNLGVIESCAFWYLAVWCNLGVIESCACILISQGRTQRDFERGSQNPAGGLGGTVSPPARSGAPSRKIWKLMLSEA